ncbi:MAG: 30S ribosomal protein S6 [Mycoplasmoidaceae bacterium]|nr:30S ribosomal protein S6 [Mycoplasmoidaceae bacterium]
MTNYEIMLVVDGNKSAADADAVSTNCQKLLKGTKDLKEEKLGLKKMAYKINGCSQAYYYVLNFACDKPEIIREFNRLTLINKDVLRFLIMNLEHNYGYRAIHNEKKVARSQKKAKIFADKQKKFEELMAAKKAAAAAELEAKAEARAAKEKEAKDE